MRLNATEESDWKFAKIVLKSPSPNSLHPGHREPKKYVTVIPAVEVLVVASASKAIQARRYNFIEEDVGCWKGRRSKGMK